MREILLIGAVLLLIGCAQPPTETPDAKVGEETHIETTGGTVKIDTVASSFGFEGYGPGKSHLGEFKEWSGELSLKDNKIMSFHATIDPSSVSTGIDGLDTHLLSGDFFDVEQYSVIEFASDNVGETTTGVLNFHGVSREISFPAEFTENSMKADFVIDTELFGMKHVAANKDVRIFFEIVY